jgi:GNAT superfamily N-acetyltransferase
VASSVRLAETDADIRRCFAVMQQLRPALGEDEFVARVRRYQGEQNWRLIYLEQDGAVAAVSGFRILDCLATGKTIYVDDLVTAESGRSKGHGETLMAWMEQCARDEGCESFALDSGTQRTRAHKFYFRLGLPIVSFRFMKKLAKSA